MPPLNSPFQKAILLVLVTCSLLTTTSAQEPKGDEQSQKGRLYFYWGWNHSWYTRSNIHFTGTHYDFTLDKVVAHDRQTPFALSPYFDPQRFTIPQYNFRIGYGISDRWDISFGMDHMKYVATLDQVVKINGSIAQSNTVYDGTYSGEDIVLRSGFLYYEHTDGLNYENIEFRHTTTLIAAKPFHLNLSVGGGAGFMLPKTNAHLLNNDRHDAFHLSGYGLGTVVAAQALFFNLFFLQTEAKTGFIHMPDIRTTKFTADKASQRFFFAQWNVVFGAKLQLKS